MTPREQVGFIGLGTMGLPMAANLVKSGFAVTAWNRSPGPAARAASAGIRVVGTPREVALEARIVITMLPDLPQVRAVLEGENGLAARQRPGDVLVVMGTVSPVALAELAEELAARNIDLLDAPVSGGEKGAEAGSLSIMVGGRHDAVERARPAFDAMGGAVVHFGPSGSGSLAKACNQLVVASTLAGLCEAVLLAERSGLEPTALLDVLGAGLAASEVLEQKRTHLLSGDFAGRGPAAYLLKDLGFALDAADAAATRLPATTVVRDMYAAVVEQGMGELDNSALLAMLRHTSS